MSAEMKTRFEVAFQGERRFAIGTIPVPTGQIVACDPFFVGLATPFLRSVPPGEYEVSLALAEIPGWGRRIRMAQLTLQPGEAAVTFEPATMAGASNGYLVQAGLGSFMDEQARAHFAQTMAQFYATHPKGNYYTDVLAAEFKANVWDKTNRFEEGSWVN